MIDRIVIATYSTTLSLLFGVIFSAQVLGFLGLYTPLSSLLLSLLAAGVMAAAYLRYDRGWLRQAFPVPAATPDDRLLRRVIVLLSLLVVGLFFGWRMLAWPYSRLGRSLAGDAVQYHFPKAVELVRTGSFWDLSIPYGQYPIGYESLVAQTIPFAGGVYWTGLVHFVILLFFTLTFYLLLRRYTALPAALCLGAATALLLIPPLYSEVLLIGKNDLLLAAALLAAALHGPFVLRRDASPRIHVYGLAAATLIGLSTKANAAPPLIFIWLLVLFCWWRAGRAGDWRDYLRPVDFVLALLLMFPCGLWVVRNYVVMGSLTSPEISSLFVGSIAYNLTNPQLYTSGMESLTLIGVTLLVAAFVAVILLWRPVHPSPAALLVVWWLTFFITPMGAFHTTFRTVVHVEWRYTLYTLVYMLVLLLVLASPLLLRAYVLLAVAPRRQAGGVALLAAAVLFAAAALNPAQMLGLDPANERVLREPSAQPVGQGGYWSAYDFVRREIHHAVVLYANGQRFYLYEYPYTNTLTPGAVHPLGLAHVVEHPRPDYLVIFPYESGITPIFEVEAWPDGWQLIYGDAQATVYRRMTEQLSAP